ncbi:MAG: HAMP domain-containing sensor histidine kinase [Oscillospiraceae bacterium]|nr:HAMP domain-containing sensor histidine kinase [Oscillospiraceae bacterium]
MIKKLKMRFVLVNMLILSFVLLATLSSIYILMANSEVHVSNEIMDTLIENHEKHKPADKMHEGPYIPDPDLFVTSNADSFSVKPVADFSDPDQIVLIHDFPYTVYNEPENNDREYFHFPQFAPGEWNPGGQNPWENPWNPPWINPWDPPWINPWEPQKPTPDHSDKPDDRPHETTAAVSVTESEATFPETDITTQTPEETTVTTVTPEQTTITTIETHITVENTPAEVPSEEIHTDPPQETQTEPETAESPETTETVTTSEIITQQSTPPSTRIPDKPKHEEKPIITTRYSGNLVRSHILAEIGKKGEILDVSYQYFFQYDNIENEQEYARKVKETINRLITDETETGKCIIENVSYRYKFGMPDDTGRKTLILLDRSIEISTLQRLMVSFIFIACAGLIIVFFLSLFLANWAIKPIELAWNKQKQFIADASHELKTPLTVISTNVDVVLSTPNDYIQNQERWLRYIKLETSRMSKLVNELLYIAKSDSNEIKMEMSEFDISNTVSGLCLVFEPLAFEAQRELVCDISPRLKLFGDEDRIKQLFTILIDNAIKYSIIGTTISVSLFRNNQGRIKFCISNKCEELTEENISKLFDRFYRVDSSRNSGTGGNGLGLNIARTIAEAHNGTVNVNYNYGMISFTVTL